MALFQPILGNISGSVGANTWSHNKGGPYIRRRTVPTNPTTLRQTSVRSYLANLSALWQTLTTLQQSSWSAYANNHPVLNRQGVSIRLPNMSWYIGLNSRLLDIGAAPVSSAPVSASPQAVTSASMSVSSNIATVTFVPPLPSGSRILLKMAKPGSPATSPNEHSAARVGVSTANATSPATIALTRNHPAGLTANYWVYVQDTFGRLSAGVRCRVVST